MLKPSIEHEPAREVPELRAGSYFPDWLPQPRRRAEQAFVSVIADAYLAGVWTSRVIEQNDEWRVAAATCRST